jgi:tetratricopeptide (TPR) repeat protein
VRRIARERQDAHAVEEVLARTPAEDWAGLAERAAFQTFGVLEKLGDMVSVAILDNNPQRALAIAAVAVSSAEAASAYPAPVLAQLRAHAWSEYARALQPLARLAEALRAIEEAYARLTGFPALAHDRAVVAHVHAETLLRIGRSQEALVLLSDAEKIFLEHGDDRRARLASAQIDQIGARVF